MGLFNINIDRLDYDVLRNGFCPICHHKGIKGLLEPESRASFDYFCPTCNKKIAITDMVLMSDFLEYLDESEESRKELYSEVQSFEGDEYHLTSTNSYYFSGEMFESNHPIPTYDDWVEGKLGAYPSRFKYFSESDRLKILEHQKYLLDKAVEERFQYFKSLFLEYEEKTISTDRFYKKLTSDIEDILENKISGNMIVGLNFEREEINKLSKQYQHSLTSGINYDLVLSPKQKYRYGACKEEYNYLIEALSLNKLLEFVSKKNNVNTSVDSDDQWHQEILDKLDSLKFEFEKLGKGQEIIFDEIDNLAENSKKLSKKDFKALAMGKLFDLGTKIPFVKENARDILEYLVGTDNVLKLLG